jgi:hypothetical protein
MPDLTIYLQKGKKIQIITVSIPYEDNMGHKATITLIMFEVFGSTMSRFQKKRKIPGGGYSQEAKKLILAAISGTLLLLEVVVETSASIPNNICFGQS